MSETRAGSGCYRGGVKRSSTPRTSLAALLFFGLVGCGGDGAGAGPGPATGGGCDFKLTVDGATYDAISCTAQGYKTFASGVYQILVSAPFSRAPAPVRSVAFVLTDSDLSSETHVKTFTVNADNPGAKATYNVTQTDQWGTLDGQVNVGSGSLTVTEYDRANKLISGTYDMVVKQGAAMKNITGSFTHLPLAKAE
jgi:hypothetical protein